MRKYVVHWLDNLGFSLSFLCAIHCILFPLMIIALPFIGLSFLLDPIYEKMFLTFSLILASVSLILGYLSHKSFKAIKIYFVASAFLLIGMYGLGHTHKIPTAVSELHATEHTLHEEDHLSNDVAHAGHDHDHDFHQTSDLGDVHKEYDLALILMILGGVALAISHFVNRKLCLSCPAHKHEGHCSHT